MIERSAKPIAEFFSKYGDRGGRWFLDIQFGRLCWASDTIAPTITTRISASGDRYIIEL